MEKKKMREELLREICHGLEEKVPAEQQKQIKHLLQQLFSKGTESSDKAKAFTLKLGMLFLKGAFFLTGWSVPNLSNCLVFFCMLRACKASATTSATATATLESGAESSNKTKASTLCLACSFRMFCAS